MTKWQINSPSSFAVINYGIVFFFVNILLIILVYLVDTKSEFIARITSWRIISVTVLNLCLIILGFFYPKFTMYCYIILPILDLFSPEKNKLLANRHPKGEENE